MTKIVSIHSFRHGTGKSNLTANLAVNIAQHGQRVGIIDTDQQSSGVHTLFGLDQEQTDSILNYYLWNNLEHQTATHQLNPLLKVEPGEVAVMGGGIYLTASNIKINEMARLLREGYDTNTLGQGLFELSRRLKLDCLLIDTNPGLAEDALLAIALSDILVLVLCLDQQNFQGIALTLDIARRLGVPQILLVANQVLPEYQPEEVKQQIEDAYGYSVAGVLPFTQELLTLSSSNVFCLRYPNHLLTQTVGAIARQIMDDSSTRQANALPNWLAAPSSVSANPGISMFELLLLPDPQRQLLNWLIRQGKASLTDCANHTQQSEAAVQTTLEEFVEQGWLQFTEIDSVPYYTPQFATKHQRLVPDRIWEALEDNTSE